MKTTIYYFSATGNSYEIARKISEKIKESSIISMNNIPSNESIGGSEESIGFVFPVYFLGLPRIVKRFIEKLNILYGTYCFAIANYGGAALNTLGMLEEILNAKGLSLSYAEKIMMPGNYIVNYPSFSSEKINHLLEKSNSKINKISLDIKEKVLNSVKQKAVLLSKTANNIIYKKVARWDNKFYSTEKCNNCGLCENICPVKNIKIENNHPVWLHHCERCTACIQWCPEEAIQYGKQTIGRKRYRHPEVKVTVLTNNDNAAKI
jgi:ferredoxin